MSLSRAKSLNPAANTDTLLLETTATYIIAVIASNMSDMKETKISIWVEPFEFLPINPGEEDQKRAYIIKDGILPPSGTYETWRFAVQVLDRICVRSNNGKASFSLEAVLTGTPVTS